MARTINEIQQSILTAKATATDLSALEVLTTSEQTLNSANSSSKVSIWRLLVWIIAFVLHIHERIVEANAENSRPHTIRWYREQCLNFLDGLPLVWKDGQFKYDLTNVVDADIRKIIDRCAVLESGNGELVIKIAKDNNGNLEPLAINEFDRFKAYIQQIKDAGNRIRYFNETADALMIDLTVEVDPLVIDLTTGQQLNITGTVKPVEDAINNYLANLEFNGALVRTFLQDEIQKAVGVKNPIINGLESKYASFPFAPIGDSKIAEAGYFKIDANDLFISYVAYS